MPRPNETDARHQRNFLKTLARGLQVLDVFTPDRPALTLTELAQEMELDPPTMLRFVYTLEYLGYLQRDPDRRSYRLTSRVLALGQSVHQQNELRSAARPRMEALARLTAETVELGVLEGLDVVVLEGVESPQPVAVRGWVGTRLPLHCTAQGKVLVAHLPPPEQAALLHRMKLEALGPKTITDRGRLEAELSRIRQRGYALNDDEMNLGILAIAAPVFGPGGRVAAALSVDAPSGRMTLQNLRASFADDLVACAADIAAALGHNPNQSN